MDSEPFDPFAEPSAELIAEMMPAPSRRSSFKPKFCQFRIEALYRIAQDTRNADLAVLTRLYELWFANFKKNPVKLNAGWFGGVGLTRYCVGRALKRLEASEQVTIERGSGKCHLVTVNLSLVWEKQTCAKTA
jgi:hypothetical protein